MTGEWSVLNTLWLVSYVVLWIAVFLLGFFLLGVLRALGVLNWRLENLQATAPTRLGRDGLKVGKKAPPFTLPGVAGGERSLHEFAGRKALLVFTQSGCGPCQAVVPELNRLHDEGKYQVLAVNNGELDQTRKWAAESGARYPILVQEKLSVSKLYQVFATPFAFLLDEQGIILSKGIAGSRQHLGYILAGARNCAKHDSSEANADEPEKREVDHFFSSKEVTHV